MYSLYLLISTFYSLSFSLLHLRLCWLSLSFVHYTLNFLLFFLFFNTTSLCLFLLIFFVFFRIGRAFVLLFCKVRRFWSLDARGHFAGMFMHTLTHIFNHTYIAHSHTNMHMHVQAHVYKRIVHYAKAVFKAETKAMIVFQPPPLLFSIFPLVTCFISY